MAKPDDDEPIEDAGGGAAEGGRGHRGLLIIAAAVIVLLGAAGGGAYFGGLLDGLAGSKTAAEAPVAELVPDPVFYALPELVVSLNTGERRSTFLKVRASLELTNPADQPRIERQLPRIVDHCQTYLRELRLEELRGSAGTSRLREELLRRISAAVAPVRVNDVLFNEMFVQ